MRRAMLDAARVAFVDSIALLTSNGEDDFGERHGYGLLHFVRPPDRRNQIDVTPEDREWLAPLLVAAARERPGPVIPNVILMVGDNDVWAGLPERDPDTLPERVYTLNRDQMTTIFGDHVMAMLEIIATHTLKDEIGRSAAMQAARWLGEVKANAGES